MDYRFDGGVDVMKLNAKQIEIREKIAAIAKIAGIDPIWAQAEGMVESSLGVNLRSPTGCRGVFGMSTVAMKDLWLEMGPEGNEIIGILAGIAFLLLLRERWKTIEEATNHFCDPNDRSFYWPKVEKYMKEFTEEI